MVVELPCHFPNRLQPGLIPGLLPAFILQPWRTIQTTPSFYLTALENNPDHSQLLSHSFGEQSGPLPAFILQLWRTIQATPSFYLVAVENIPDHSQLLSHGCREQWVLHCCKIKSGSGLGTRLAATHKQSSRLGS